MKKIKTLALLLIAGCAPLSVSAQRVINLNDENAGISLKAIPRGIEVLPDTFPERAGYLRARSRVRSGNMEVTEIYPGQIKVFRPLAVNPALQSPETVSLGDTVILELFEDKVYKAVVASMDTNKTGWINLGLKFPDNPDDPFSLTSATISTGSSGKSRVHVRLFPPYQSFSTNPGVNEQWYLIEEDGCKAPRLSGNDGVLPSSGSGMLESFN